MQHEHHMHNYMYILAPCSQMNCEHFCVSTADGTGQCICSEGFDLQDSTCVGKSNSSNTSLIACSIISENLKTLHNFVLNSRKRLSTSAGVHLQRITCHLQFTDPRCRQDSAYS